MTSKGTLLIAALLTILTGAHGSSAIAAEGQSASGSVDKLEQGFLAPPDEYRPGCYWWWLNGAASPEGITRDMEEMRKQGIGEATIFDAGGFGVSYELQKGPPFLSEAWREFYRHAVREANRCGITLSVNLCSGWNAGGPWVTPAIAAKVLVYSHAGFRSQGQQVRISIPKPPALQGYYSDIVYLAVPVADYVYASANLTSGPKKLAATQLEDGNEKTEWSSKKRWPPGTALTTEAPEILEFSYCEPWFAAGCYLGVGKKAGPKEIEIRCSEDGKTYRPLKRVSWKQAESGIISFDETQAKSFQIVILESYPSPGANVGDYVALNEVAMLTKGQVSSGIRPPPRMQLDRSAIIDVTSYADNDGVITWDAPAGDWRILRIGTTLLDRMTHNPGSGPEGREIDPMSEEAMDTHFAETGAKLIADAGVLAGRTLRYFMLDSWEFPMPTWTTKMRQEFQERRGYDPVSFLPIVLGMPTVDQAEAQRFMSDYRTTAAELVAKNYYGRLAELTVKGGLEGTTCEAGGPYFTHWIDALQCQGKQVIPMGEFWKREYEPDGPIALYDKHNLTVKQAASAAHIYGKKACQAEAFTSKSHEFTEDPWSLKDLGDSAFCDGLTKIVFHHFVTQVHPDRKPGIYWHHIGLNIGPTTTWWPMASSWLTYIARCQFMLRQGLFVADFAYLQSETIPSFTALRTNQQPMRPPGFDYDTINAEVLLDRAQAKNGRLTLPDGMSYRYLVLPHDPHATLSPRTVARIVELSQLGVVVVGPERWNKDIAGLRNTPLDSLVRTDGLPPDVEFSNQTSGAELDWIHRSTGNTDIYFISNQKAFAAETDLTLRLRGRIPEIWDAVTGTMRAATAYSGTADGRTHMKLHLAARQSLFLVFRKAARMPDVTSGDDSPNSPGVTVADLKGPWTVRFAPAWLYPDGAQDGIVNFDTLMDWTARPESSIRHFSGIATYRIAFDLPGNQPVGTGLRLDLGEVRNVARVKLNGHDLGVVWTAPWQVDITKFVKNVQNNLEIDIANLWPNRLIGDGLLEPDQRRAATNIYTYNQVLPQDSMNMWPRGWCNDCIHRHKNKAPPTLLPSGLLGPVRIMKDNVAPIINQ